MYESSSTVAPRLVTKGGAFDRSTGHYVERRFDTQVTLATTCRFTTTALPRSEKANFFAVVPIAQKSTSSPKPKRLPNWISGIPDNVQSGDERFLMRSVSWAVPAAARHGCGGERSRFAAMRSSG